MTKKKEYMDDDDKKKLIDMALMQVELPDDTIFFSRSNVLVKDKK